MSSQQGPFIPQKKQVDVFCPIHGNWIGHYDYGSIGSYYCWCKKCKKEIKIVMGKWNLQSNKKTFVITT